MGVRGLHSFIARNPGSFKLTRLHNTYVVIDADNLVSNHYRESGLANYYGGELIEFQIYVLKFVRLLQRCCIKPIFIFGGCLEQSGGKRETLLDRNMERINALWDFIQQARASADPDRMASLENLLPKLAHQVVMELLDECGVPYICGTRKAKLQMAELAVVLNCPLMSNNSDFYIFQSLVPSRYRVIPFSLLKTTCDQLPTKCAVCGSQSATCYGLSCSVFCQYPPCLNKVKPHLLPLLAVLLNNDASSNVRPPDSVECLIKQSQGAKRVHDVLHWLERFSDEPSGAIREILSGYTRFELEEITKQVAQCIHGYFLDSFTDGFELANELNLPTDTAFALHSPPGNPPVNIDSISVKTLDEAVSLLSQALAHWEVAEVEMNADFCFRWPRQLKRAYRTGRITISLLDALYMRGGGVLWILYEDLNYTNSIYSVSEYVRSLNYSLLVELENRNGCSHKLRWLTDGKPIESRREGKRMSTFSVQLPVACMPRGESAVERFHRFFRQYLSMDLISSVVCDSPEMMGIVCVLTVWLRHTSIKKVNRIPLVRNPVGLAFITCALVTALHYEYFRRHDGAVVDHALADLSKRYGQVAGYAKCECVTNGHQGYSIEVVHQLNELQLVYVELQHLTTLLEVMCTCNDAKEDPIEGDIKTGLEMRLRLWPAWVIFSSGRLLYWLAQTLACASSEDRFNNLQVWIPALLRTISSDITPPSVSELSKRVSDVLEVVQRMGRQC